MGAPLGFRFGSEAVSCWFYFYRLVDRHMAGIILGNTPGSLLGSLVDISPVVFLVNWYGFLLVILSVALLGTTLGLQYGSEVGRSCCSFHHLAYIYISCY